MSYSGGGITVLQLVLETVAGESFPSIVQKFVFEPLGMNRSFYSLPDNETNIAQAYYTGYTACEDRWRSNPEQAAAGLWTTPSEILKVVRALQESLVGNKEGNFLEKEIAQQMLIEVSDGMALTWYAPKDPGLGFGHPGSNVYRQAQRSLLGKL
jgi:CubicO group peptidase (beta-lactamase class C family)